MAHRDEHGPELRLALSTTANDVCVALSGDLVVGSVALFHSRLDPLLGVNPDVVVVDLRNLGSLDCAGAAALELIGEQVAVHDGCVVLQNPSGDVEQLLQRCGVGPVRREPAEAK